MNWNRRRAAASTGRSGPGLADALWGLFDPLIAEYFGRRFGRPTPAQSLGWPVIRSGRDALIIAPTGSGKTLAAFLVTIDELVRWNGPPASKEEEPPRIHTLYVSPLRALSHDIHRSLEQPLEELSAAAREQRRPWRAIEVAVRTADTPERTRRAMVRRPPHLLITTPESLFLMLLSPRLRPALARVRRVIIDELHALAPTKRGAHLALCLELLDELTGHRAQRIGLSATVRPPEAAAAFLGGDRAAQVQILDTGGRRQMDLQVVLPAEDFPGGPEGTVWPSIVRRLLELVEAHRSTLVFVNNRRQAERLTHQLNELAGRRLALTHHGSMSRAARLYVEQALKAGELRAVVATATLELGIDVGFIDLVVHVESPAEVAQGLQRVGRSGHAVAASSKGRIIPKNPGDLLEAAAAARAIAAFDIEPLHPVRQPLDVLAQFVAGAATVRSWDEDELFALVRRAQPFADLSREMFRDVLALMAGDVPLTARVGVPGPHGAGVSPSLRPVRPRIRRDLATGRITAAPGTLPLLYANAGTIPDRGLYPVYLQGTDVKLGELDEEFTYERRRGDVFWLGMGAWRIEEIRPDRVIVSRASQAGLATIPFWRGEGLSRSTLLGRHAGSLLAQLERRLGRGGDDAERRTARWLQESCNMYEAAAAALLRYAAR
ncbi:MAG: DEAD/DEAH box helicase, partial [Bacillota bacterium]